MGLLEKFCETPRTNTLSELIETLKGLTKDCQSEEIRLALDKTVFSELSCILDAYFMSEQKEMKSWRKDEVALFTEAFRFIRSSVVNCKGNQDVIRDRSRIIPNCMSFLKGITTSNYGDDGESLSEEEEVVVAIRCCLQAVANLMADNEMSCKVVVHQLNEAICPLVVKLSEDEKIVQYSAMIFHLALKFCPEWALEMDLSVLPVTFENTQSDFVIFVLESLTCNEAFMKSRFLQLETENRVKFLKILIAHDEFHSRIHPPIIGFFGERFKSDSDLILKSQLQTDSWVCWEIACLLELLCCITSIDDTGDNVSNLPNSSLLTTSIFLLRSVHAVGKDSSSEDNYLQPVRRLESLRVSDDTEDMRSHPTFQFKAHLIRLIANLVHRNFENQELVRKLEALPVILDCCQIDARNPFITQWAVLAIRNACEGNSANQDFINQVQRVDTENAVSSSKVHLVGL